MAGEALKLEGVDEQGLDDLDRSYLSTIIRHYHGGPVGVEALSATLNEKWKPWSIWSIAPPARVDQPYEEWPQGE